MLTFVLHCLQFAILLGYFVIAAQGAFYHLTLGKVLMIIPTSNFLELRQVIDRHIRKPLKVLYLGTPLLMLIWMVLSIGRIPLWDILYTGIALVLLLADIRLILKNSEPINQLVNQLTDLPNVEGGANLQRIWVKTMLHRGCYNGFGFILLIISQVFG